MLETVKPAVSIITEQIDFSQDWIPISSLRPIILGDPCQVWLKYWGKRYGLKQDPSEYSFLEFVGKKGIEFEKKWIREICPPDIEPVCHKTWHSRRFSNVRKTWEMMDEGREVIYQGALWYPEFRIYGAPDLICLKSWAAGMFSSVGMGQDEEDHYIILDLKFTTDLDSSSKRTNLRYASAQVRFYTFILGCMQQHMPEHAYLITRDRIHDPLPVPISSRLGEPLDEDLAGWCEMFREIKTNGPSYRPWRDEWLEPNFRMENDEPWHEAKKEILNKYMQHIPLDSLYGLHKKHAEKMKACGYECFEDLLKVDPDELPLRENATADVQKAILRASRSGRASRIPPEIMPPKKKIELFVDFEYFTNLNVDFELEWPEMKGQPMIFMVGIGWEERGEWTYRILTADEETTEAEKKLFREFYKFLDHLGVFDDPDSAAVYSWTPTERRQTRTVCERLGLSYSEELELIPWVDLQEPFRQGPIAIPGAVNFGLKSVALALSKYDPRFAVAWPDELGAGLRAMVVGWEMFKSPKPLETHEYSILCRYLETDIKAMWQILRWLRSGNRRSKFSKAKE